MFGCCIFLLSSNLEKPPAFLCICDVEILKKTESFTECCLFGGVSDSVIEKNRLWRMGVAGERVILQV